MSALTLHPPVGCLCELFIAPRDVCVNSLLSLMDVYVNFSGREGEGKREGGREGGEGEWEGGKEGGWEGRREGTTFCYFVQCSPGTIRRAC